MRLSVRNIDLVEHTSGRVRIRCARTWNGLVVGPISPVRGTYVVDSFVSFDIEPVVIPKPTTWKSDDLRPCAVDDGEF